ncbi:MAG TPA: hypothetical protein VGQ67_12530, partial [Candidatus Polarisedimenticolia bacterium]|jgi:ribosomal protein S5|nr:hypothetical protein [Candidatus Polarisedimenticolia bacterium]
MKTRWIAIVFLVTLLGTAALQAAPETWSHVALMDNQCATKFKDNPDKHDTKCALQCQKAGYGIYAQDGSFLKLDTAGNQKALAALKGTSQTDHLRATVTGERQGDTIKVASLKLDEPAAK